MGKKNIDNGTNTLSLLFLMLVGLWLIFRLISKFYTWTIIDWLPLIIRNKHFIPGDIMGNDMMYISSIIYGVMGIGILIYLFKERLIKNDKKRGDKWYYKMITLTTLGVYLLFYITNPWYTFQSFPKLFLYEDGKNMTNKDIYFFFTERYGFNPNLYKPFKTLDDSIDGLEFAKKIKEPSLYKIIFDDTEKLGYENLVKDYTDSSFQLYFLNYILFTSQFHDGKINNLEKNLNYIKLILSVAKNNEIIDLSNELQNKLEHASKLNQEEMKQVIDDYLKIYLDKIFNTNIDKSNFL